MDGPAMKLFTHVRLHSFLADLTFILQESAGQEPMRLPARIQDGMIQSDATEFVPSVSEEALQDAWAIALMQDPEIEASRWQTAIRRAKGQIPRFLMPRLSARRRTAITAAASTAQCLRKCSCCAQSEYFEIWLPCNALLV